MIQQILLPILVIHLQIQIQQDNNNNRHNQNKKSVVTEVEEEEDVIIKYPPLIFVVMKVWHLG